MTIEMKMIVVTVMMKMAMMVVVTMMMTVVTMMTTVRSDDKNGDDGNDDDDDEAIHLEQLQMHVVGHTQHIHTTHNIPQGESTLPAAKAWCIYVLRTCTKHCIDYTYSIQTHTVYTIHKYNVHTR